MLETAIAASAPAGLRPTGQGRLTFFGLHVYDAALWTAPGFRGSAFAEQPFVLDLQYARDFSAADIARRSLDEMRRHGPFDATQAARWQSKIGRAHV